MLIAAAGCVDDGADSGAGADTTGTTETTELATTAPAATMAPETTEPAPTEPATTVPSTAPPAEPADPALLADIEAALAAAPEGCDPLDTRHCFLPFPSNIYTTADDDSDTGRRVQFPAAGAPANADGTLVDVAEWNRGDGFSPNTTIITYVGGLDPAASELPPWTELETSLADDAAVVLVDIDSGERIPLWAELDAQPDRDADRALIVHPAISLPEGHTFAIGLRGLVARGGVEVQPSAGLPRLPRRAEHRAPHDRGSPPGDGGHHRRTGGCGRRARRAAAGVGLHGGQHPQSDRAHAPHPGPNALPLGRRGSAVHGRLVHRRPRGP